MSYTQWVSNGTNVSYVPKEKDTGEVITPFTTTAPGGVPNSSYAPSTYVLAASGAWIPQTVGTSSSEVRRPTAYTLLTSNPSPYFEATDTSLVYDSDTNHLTTNGRFELQGLSAQNDASFKFSSFQTKAQTWTSATLNISRNYASTRWTSGTEARYYLSTDGGTNWTLLLTDDYDNDPVTVTIFSHTLATANPSSLSNYQVKVEIDAFSSGALGSVGVLDLQLYDIWIEGIYTVSGGSGTVTSITTTGANGVTISGGSTQTITTSGTFALALGNITPTSISTGTGSFSGDVEFAASIKSPNGSNSPVTIVPDGTGDLHVNADSLRLGDNNANATIATNGSGDLLLTTHEGSAVEGVIRLYDGANGNITLTPNGTGQVQVGSDQVVTITASQTLTNKTLSTSSTWNGNTIGVAYGGTGSTTLTSGSYVVGNGTSAVTLKTPTQVTADLDTFTYQIGATAGKKGLVPAAPAIGASVVYLDQTGSWTTPSGSGTTTNALTISSPLTGTSFNGSTAVTIALGSGYGDTQNPYGSKTANYFLASPNGSAGVPTWRSIVAADIPTLNQSTTGTAANITASSNTTLTTLSSLVSIGTITTGTWNASAIGVAYGGTGLTTLTAGYIPYGNGTSAFGSSANLFWDSTNSRLGVGTSSPAFKLHTYIASGTSMFKFESGANAGIYGYWTRPNQSYIQALNLDNNGDKDFSLYDATNGQVADRYYPSSTGYRAFFTNGTERMRIDSSGNVGIGGTASNGNRLYVVGSNTTSNTSIPIYANQVYGNTGVSSAAIRLNLNDGAGGCYLYGYSGGAGFMHNAEYLAGTGWTARSTFASIMETTSSGFSFYLNSSLTAGNTFTPSEQMRLTSTGLGIGTSSPSAKLHVANGGSNAQATFVGTTGSPYITVVANSGTTILGNESNGGWVGTTGSQAFVFKTNDTERMRIDSSGNLGIGTSSPSLPLHVYNSGAALAYFESTNANGPYVIWRSSGTSIGDVGSGKGISGSGNVTDFMIASRSTYPMILGTGSTERMRIDSSGNVGIGRTPSYTLDLAGDARFKRNSGSGWVFQTPSSDMRIVGETSGAHLCFIPSSANVGIDTTSPSEKLNVIGKIKASDVLLGNNGTKGYGAITTTTSTSTPTGGSSGDHYYIY